MKKTVIKCLYLAAVFFISLFLSSVVMNKGNTDMTAEMGQVSYPVIHMKIGNREVNSLHGYRHSMQCSYQRDNITPLADGRKISITVNKWGQSIEGLTFEVRSIDGSRLVESTEIIDYDENDDTIKATFSIKDLIEDGEEYMLVFLLKNGSGQTIRYYTRIIQTDEYYVNEKVDYVLDFHRRTFHKEQAKELTKYLESNADGDNTTYSKVTIHSSFKQITWGDLAVEKVTEPQVTLKELNTQTASIELDYMVSIIEGKQTRLYTVKEFYRIRYTSDRIYLLDFERTMKQIFDANASAFTGNKIDLGIHLAEDITLVESDGGNVFAFTDGSRLYCYNVNDNKLSLLFSFYDDNYQDERETWKKHQIKILSVDEAGNVKFTVYGYMNRGRHEGEVGISVYNYSGLLNTVEELVFIPSDRSYEILKAEIEQLSYINKSDIFFFMHHRAIYAVNLANRMGEIMVSDLKEESYEISDSSKMVVWQVEDNLYSTKKLVLMNLNTKQKTEIEAGTDEYIKPLGFMEEDLIYGLAKSKDVVRDNTGNVLFPMYLVNIENEGGDILTSYSQEGMYIISSEIRDNQISLQRLEKDEETGIYTETSNDQILNTKSETTGNNLIEVVPTEKYEKIVQIAIKKNIETKTLKELTPKEVLFEGGRTITLKESESEIPKYYVYGKNGVEGIFTDEGNAVNLAYEKSGVVVNESGSYVWIRGNLSLKNQIMAIKGLGITEEKDSLAICLDTILKYEGIMRNTEYLLNRGENILDILNENLNNAQILDLTGCSLSSILYYINKDIPVLATLNDGNAVLIVGFNELNVVIMDPLTGIVEKKGMNDSKQMFEENGNRFITYIKNE